jgi:hypothetical protein
MGQAEGLLARRRGFDITAGQALATSQPGNALNFLFWRMFIVLDDGSTEN